MDVAFSTLNVDQARSLGGIGVLSIHDLTNRFHAPQPLETFFLFNRNLTAIRMS
jgi:hypothetical protein